MNNIIRIASQLQYACIIDTIQKYLIVTVINICAAILNSSVMLSVAWQCPVVWYTYLYGQGIDSGGGHTGLGSHYPESI